MSALVEDMTRCYVCGRTPAQAHHVIYGTSNRKISDRYSYLVPLCIDHHTGQNGVHHGNKKLNLHLKQMAQKHFEDHYGSREDFIKIFGKSYL